MEKISSSETLRDVINGMTVQGTVHKEGADNSRIENGSIAAENGQWLANWAQGGDNSLSVNYGGHCSDRAAVLSAIESFIAEATAE